ncbi:hypothetical protein AAG906_012044 [Vitis piasezkii]
MEEAKTMKTPMSSSIKLHKDEKGKSIVSTMYRGMIGSLLYLTASRPNLMYSGFGFGPPSLPPARHSQLLLNFRAPKVSVGIFTRMGWLPVVTVSEQVFQTLVQAFYSRATYGLGGLIISYVRGVKIRLDPESICRIFDIALVGLKNTTHVLPYGHFLTRVFKDVDRPPAQARGQGLAHPGVEEETEIREMEGKVDPQNGPSSQPSFTEPPHTEIPPHQAPHTPDHAPWMDLSTQISSLGTRMEELAVVSDTRFYSMEDCMDQYQASFTSQFEHL